MKEDLKKALEKRGCYNSDLMQEILDLFLVMERETSIDFAKHLEGLSSVDKVTVHPSLRNMRTDELFDKYKRKKNKNAL